MATTSQIEIPVSSAVTVISSTAVPWRLPIREMWRYRELLYFLTWRDIKVRYKQTVLGVMWAILQPLFIALTLSLFLGRLGGVPSDGIPYPVFAYAGMTVWQLFSHALTEASNSLIANERLITKVYFPRILVPMAALISSLVDFAVALVVLIPFLVYYHVVPRLSVLTLPLFILLVAMLALGSGLWLSALNIKYRDARYTLGFLVQLWFFATPVAYPASVVPERWKILFGLNPMVGLMEGVRWSIFGNGDFPAALLGVSLGAITLIVIGGLIYFQKTEATFADYL